MSDINHVSLVGRLTRDAEYRSLDQDRGVIRFSLAVNRTFRRGTEWVSEPNFFDGSYFVTSDRVMAFLKKGTQIAVSGELRQNRWEKDGQKYSKVEIQAQRVQLLSSSRQESNLENRNTSSHNFSNSANLNTNTVNTQQSTKSAPKNFDQDDFEEDFPF